LTSSALRAALAPVACHGVSTPAGRSLQDEFDGVVACFKALLDEHEQLQDNLDSLRQLVLEPAGDRAAGEVLQDVQLLLQKTAGRHLEKGQLTVGDTVSGQDKTTSPAGPKDLLEEDDAKADQTQARRTSSGASRGQTWTASPDIIALRRRLSSWEARVRTSQTPSRVLIWATATGPQ
jgi:hypothetical protein